MCDFLFEIESKGKALKASKWEIKVLRLYVHLFKEQINQWLLKLNHHLENLS